MKSEVFCPKSEIQKDPKSEGRGLAEVDYIRSLKSALQSSKFEVRILMSEVRSLKSEV